jgi:hypothetical protein
MSKTTRLSHAPKKKRYASQYAHGGLKMEANVVTATTKAQNRPKIKIAATGDKFNTYKTRIS